MEQEKKQRYFKCSDWVQDGVKVNVFITPRSIGKTTDMLKRGVSKYKETGKSFIILRNTDAEVKEYVRNGENVKFWRDEYGYELKGRSVMDNSGEKKELVITILALSNWYNQASSNFDNVSMVFYEEFHSRSERHMINTDSYRQFLGFFFTVERNKPDFELWMATNYIPDIELYNPFMIRWGIKKGAKVSEIMGGLGRFYQLTSDDYKPMNYTSNSSISSALAQYDPEYLDASVHGGFIPSDKYNIVYNYEVSDFEYIKTVVYKDRFIDIGTANIKGKLCYLFTDFNKKNKNIVKEALDNEASLNYGLPKMDAMKLKDTADEILRLLPISNIWFSNIQIHNIITEFAIRLSGRFNDI